MLRRRTTERPVGTRRGHCWTGGMRQWPTRTSSRGRCHWRQRRRWCRRRWVANGRHNFNMLRTRNARWTLVGKWRVTDPGGRCPHTGSYHRASFSRCRTRNGKLTQRATTPVGCHEHVKLKADTLRKRSNQIGFWLLLLLILAVGSTLIESSRWRPIPHGPWLASNRQFLVNGFRSWRFATVSLNGIVATAGTFRFTNRSPLRRNRFGSSVSLLCIHWHWRVTIRVLTPGTAAAIGYRPRQRHTTIGWGATERLAPVRLARTTVSVPQWWGRVGTGFVMEDDRCTATDNVIIFVTRDGHSRRRRRLRQILTFAFIFTWGRSRTRLITVLKVLILHRHRHRCSYSQIDTFVSKNGLYTEQINHEGKCNTRNKK